MLLTPQAIAAPVVTAVQPLVEPGVGNAGNTHSRPIPNSGLSEIISALISKRAPLPPPSAEKGTSGTPAPPFQPPIAPGAGNVGNNQPRPISASGAYPLPPSTIITGPQSSSSLAPRPPPSAEKGTTGPSAPPSQPPISPGVGTSGDDQSKYVAGSWGRPVGVGKGPAVLAGWGALGVEAHENCIMIN
ncbi:hypothetical protein HGRIS_007154 [Hohenbuehelia grisea]|uniref:Uncharacterized protein n=1 Tax=Hohenbuehelia grisea TaxID=104357 RepID=A0ABR3JBL9_9AGAR